MSDRKFGVVPGVNGKYVVGLILRVDDNLTHLDAGYPTVSCDADSVGPTIACLQSFYALGREDKRREFTRVLASN